jgi:hypothetical protein
MCYNFEDAEKESNEKDSQIEQIEAPKKGQNPGMERDDPDSSGAFPVDQLDKL